MLDTGGFLALKEEDLVHGEWHAGSDEGQPSAQPRLKITFRDSVLHVAVPWRNDPATGSVSEAVAARLGQRRSRGAEWPLGRRLSSAPAR